MSLAGRVVDRAELADATVRSMFRLFERIYENVDEGRFRRDLGEKRWVVLLEDGGEVRGFSTLAPMRVGPVRAVFSGDTVVDPAYWGEWELARTWGRFVLGLGADVWFLISKGYRTYLLLPLFLRDFWPRHDRPTPEPERALIEALARARYPREFNAATGVIEFAEPHGNLRPERGRAGSPLGRSARALLPGAQPRFRARQRARLRRLPLAGQSHAHRSSSRSEIETLTAEIAVIAEDPQSWAG